MSSHEWFVAVAWGLALLAFAVMVGLTLRRQAVARRRLAALEAAPGGRQSGRHGGRGRGA